MNDDGRLDFVVVHLEDGDAIQSIGRITALLNDGDGAFTGHPANSPEAPQTVAIADLNGDGRLDLAVAGEGLHVLLGSGGGSFGAPTEVLDAAARQAYVAVGDLNEDGRADLATSSLTEQSVTILLGRGDGTFAAPASIPGRRSTGSIASGSSFPVTSRQAVIRRCRRFSSGSRPATSLRSRQDRGVSRVPRRVERAERSRKEGLAD